MKFRSLFLIERCHAIWCGLKLVAISASIVASWTVGAQAAQRTVADVGSYKGADRQALLEEGAKQEGALEIYTTGTQADPIFEAFMARYPYVRLDAFRGDTPTVTRRILEEYKANRYVADAIDLSIGGLIPMQKAGILQGYWSPELANVKKEAIEPSNFWTIGYESYISLGYNTKQVSEADVPKTLDDLLDPKWKGKMALPTGSTLVEWVGALTLEKDEAFVRKLGLQNLRVYEVTARAVANLVVSGEVALSPAMYNSHFASSASQGANVAWRPLGGVEAFVGAFALTAKAPHPNAAMLYIDFALSPAGQALFQKLGYASSRTDMKNADKPEKVYYLAGTPTFQRDFDKWNALAKQVFGVK